MSSSLAPGDPTKIFVGNIPAGTSNEKIVKIFTSRGHPARKVCYRTGGECKV
jgi:hypothetical protein